MKKLRICLVILFAAASSAMHGCSRRAPQRAPEELRIISLAPNVTEILFALGLGKNIVGVTDLCDYPPAAAKIERISGFGAPNVEALLALAPDMVIACGLEKPEFLNVLRRSGVRVVNVQKSGLMAGFPELFDAIRAIGAATGRPADAQSLIARMQTELDAIAGQLATVNAVHRPRVFVEIEQSPLMTAGAGSFIDDLIARAGGQNVAHEILAAYPRINPEQVIAWDPEVILVAHADRPGDAARRLERRIGWANVTAVRTKNIIDDIDADLLFRPGPRLVDGVKALAARLHPK